jgi:hypothetical protein
MRDSSVAYDGNMKNVDQALQAQSQASTPSAAPLRSALALGFAGALGEELLSLLVGSGEYRQVHVGVTQPIGSATARFAPWVVGHGTPLVDDAWICLTGEETFVPKATPIRRFGEDELLAAAQIARDAGARRLAVVAPLAALLQMGVGASHISSQAEVDLAAMGFERLVIVRPTAADAQLRPGPWLARVVRAMGRALGDIMLPRYAQQLSPRNAALAIMEGVRTRGDGAHVLGARDLLALIEARLPGLAPKKTRLR